MPPRGQIAAPLLAALLLAPLLLAADNLAQLREKLAREDDPDDRAKITVEIGETLLQDIGKAFHQGRIAEGKKLLTEYVEAIRKANEDLKESGRDARRKPKGFKDLEIHLRRSHRELQDLGHLLTYEERAPIRKALGELEAIREELLQNLMSRDDESG
jgi:hypothetical protein